MKSAQSLALDKRKVIEGNVRGAKRKRKKEQEKENEKEKEKEKEKK